jgi:rubrerythrin
MFETEKDVLDWYERQPRTLNKEFVSRIPWAEVVNHPLSPTFLTVLTYMRDVEKATEIYHKEFLRTPVGRSPIIRRFLDRWSGEEDQHAELLNRFLNEAGGSANARWWKEAKASIPRSYKVGNYVSSLILRPLGERIAAGYMAWAAINEMSTLQAYRRMWKLAGHPVLEKLLRGIAREESVHATFFWNIARLKLEQSELTRKCARLMIGKWWTPVGQGVKPQEQTDMVIGTLFAGEAGASVFARTVGRRTERLPGLEGLKLVTERITAIAISGHYQSRLITI